MTNLFDGVDMSSKIGAHQSRKGAISCRRITGHCVPVKDHQGFHATYESKSHKLCVIPPQTIVGEDYVQLLAMTSITAYGVWVTLIERMAGNFFQLVLHAISHWLTKESAIVKGKRYIVVLSLARTESV
jgi:hypothetical protein